jgi:hypothetical protein
MQNPIRCITWYLQQFYTWWILQHISTELHILRGRFAAVGTTVICCRLLDFPTATTARSGTCARNRAQRNEGEEATQTRERTAFWPNSVTEENAGEAEWVQIINTVKCLCGWGMDGRKCSFIRYRWNFPKHLPKARGFGKKTLKDIWGFYLALFSKC